MNIDKAANVIARSWRRVPIRTKPVQPEGCTVWNNEPNVIVQEAVYFAYSAGLVKIGFSIRPRQRLAQLQAASASPVSMVLIVPGTEADETRFHERFAADRVHHEWFALSKPMRDFFRARLCVGGRQTLRDAEAVHSGLYIMSAPASALKPEVQP